MLNVRLCGALATPTCTLPKLMLFGIRATYFSSVDPDRYNCNELAVAPVLKATTTRPVEVAAAIGLYVTEKVQVPPAASVLGLTGQLFVWANRVPTFMLVSVTALESVFFNVTN